MRFLALQVLTRLLILEFEWGIAWFIGWFFGSIIVFYAVGLLATVISIIDAVYFFTRGYRKHYSNNEIQGRAMAHRDETSNSDKQKMGLSSYEGREV
jgi:hypothetical protein